MSVFIKARDVGLDMPIFTQEQRSSRASLGVFLKAAIHPPQRSLRTTLDGLSFDFNAGDRVAVVGKNGAGKSTLLKVLVGAYPPTRGVLEVSGKRQALLNLSLGFSPEATLIENILLRGIAMGLRPAQAEAVIDEVLSFAELEEKAGHRLRTLSSGQRMRLGFAMATSIQNEILIMDEWIGTGDAGFVEKAKARIQNRVDSAEIVVLASHRLSLLYSVCNKALLMEGGRIVQMGGVREVLGAYEDQILGRKA
ncbi:ATP-binding cassette domain-containing protein [Pseudomonas sp. R2.Fl]|nr:ATP-binding cassette domain-containing protein [Pseudomonas sp. R2.Fl]